MTHLFYFSSRGLLTVILCTPYEKRDDWIIEAVKWNGTIYLLQLMTDKRLLEKRNETSRQKQMSSWGYKFEQLVTSPDPAVLPDTNQPVDENEEFCCLFRTKVNGLSLVYGAEMDAYQSQQIIQDSSDVTLDAGKFVELKTSRIVEHDRQERNFR